VLNRERTLSEGKTVLNMDVVEKLKKIKSQIPGAEFKCKGLDF